MSFLKPMAFLKARFARLKAVGRRIQARALSAGLWLLYVVGFGATWPLVRMFRPRMLTCDPEAPPRWEPADTYAWDESTSTTQS